MMDAWRQTRRTVENRIHQSWALLIGSNAARDEDGATKSRASRMPALVERIIGVD